jgi:hypothetical protein
MNAPSRRPPTGVFILATCGVWLIGLGVYFMFLRPALLPEDLRFIAAGPGGAQAIAPGLERWTRHVFTVMGGFMAGAGVLTILVSTNAAVARARWSRGALALTGLLTVGTMSLTNFQLDSDFKWLLVIPAALWVVGLALFPSPSPPG